MSLRRCEWPTSTRGRLGSCALLLGARHIRHRHGGIHDRGDPRADSSGDTAWAVGTYTVYSFIASFLATATPLRGPQVGYALFLWGASAGVGVIIGGNATDKLGARAVIRTSLSVLALALAGLSTVAHVLPPTIALPPVLLAMIAWGLCHWGSSGAANGLDPDRRREARADRPLAQCVLHVSGLLARRRGGASRSFTRR